MIGRPWLYALGSAGGAGVNQMLELMRKELVCTMGMAGITKVSDIGLSSLVFATKSRNHKSV
jgi:L-lactate dehydrogenase (cytochrome)